MEGWGEGVCGKSYLIKTIFHARNKLLLYRHSFFSGDGGYGKLHLIKKHFHLFNQLLLYQGGDPNKLRVVALAPIGVATININGTTIHYELIIPGKGKLFPLNDQNYA